MHKEDTKQKVKPRLAAQFEEHEVWHGKWQNCHFLKDGRSVLGDAVWSSRQEASAKLFITYESGAYTDKMPRGGIDFGPIGPVRSEQYSHAIQLPILE